MSPRAAWRLETLGFEQVYDYEDGKADWSAAGLPVQGAGGPTVAEAARIDVATCRLDEAADEVARRIDESPYQTAFVVNDQNVVLGRVLASSLTDVDSRATVEDVMQPGPSTFRPNVPVEEMAEYMVNHGLKTAPITSSDGRLVGLVLLEDVQGHLPGAGR